MKRIRPGAFSELGLFIAVAAFFLSCAPSSKAQDNTAPKGTIKDGYAIRQTFDLGGHIADYSGSGAMYDTLVNLQSGPRILNQSLEMHALQGSHHFLFDTLSTNSTGYGGDPNNVTMFRMSKGKLYDFQGIFRRDRQYFDYDLLANPLVPPTSNPYVPVLNSPHLFNTVRRITDTTLTLFPLSVVSFRAGYSQNVNEGPSYSTIHFGAEALLSQYWRNSTDTWLGAIDWKPSPKTTFTYEEIVTHYKGNTFWQLAGLNYQLANGTPVSLGIDIFPATGSPCATPFANSSTTPPTVNPACNGYLQYYRYTPTRVLFPTEGVRFQSSALKNVQMTGRLRYTSANMNLPDYNEYFNGLVTRTSLRAATYTGFSKAKRISVDGDYGIVWQIAPKVSFSEQYDFWYFRQPSSNSITETDQLGRSMLTPPGSPGTPTTTFVANYLSQKTEMNTLMAEWQASARASVSLGWRWRLRNIVVSSDGSGFTVPIHENGLIFGVVLRPSPQWRINGDVEASYADNTFTQISPRQMQRYRVRTLYQPGPRATISLAFNDLEQRNNVAFVNHLDHARFASAGLWLMPNEHFGLDMNYGYSDIFTRTNECYASTPPLAGAPAAPTPCIRNNSPYLATGYYDAPTQYGSVGITWSPVKKFHSNLGYRMSAVNGTTEFLNPRQVPGSLQSQFQSPYANVAWTLAPGWIWKADWNYYGYGEGTPIGPTLPRSFRGNVYTLGMHYEF